MKLILVLLIVAYSRSSNAVGDNFPPDLDINDMSTFKGFDNHMGINPWKDSIETIGQKFAVSYTLIISLFLLLSFFKSNTFYYKEKFWSKLWGRRI